MKANVGDEWQGYGLVFATGVGTEGNVWRNFCRVIKAGGFNPPL